MTHPSPFTETYYLTDGGLETDLIFNHGIELRHFASFELLNTERGRQALEIYYRPYIELAAARNTGFILETPTWRANPDWGYRMGYTIDALRTLNEDAVRYMQAFASRAASPEQAVVISGNIGPRADGYTVGQRMSVEESKAYHLTQIAAFAQAKADVVSALTLNYIDEAIGMVEAARACAIPIVISFTVETDGTLSSGETLQAAIEQTDAATDDYVNHYMINCAHPQHFQTLFAEKAAWHLRIKGIRANASTKSHAELDEAETLDKGDRCDLAANYAALRKALPNLSIFGGCCGTDFTHIQQIATMLFEAQSVPFA